MSDESLVIVCQGPPVCRLDGDAAVNAQKAGCVWCKRIYIDSIGRERIVEPGVA